MTYKDGDAPIFDNLFFLEVLNDKWPTFLKDCRERLYGKVGLVNGNKDILDNKKMKSYIGI